MGTYPVGSLVILSSGEIGLVLEQNLKEKLSPKIALLTDKNVAMLEKPKLVDLANQEKSKINRSIVTSYRSKNAANKLAGGKDLDPRNYCLSFFGKRVGLGPLSLRV